ncbi:MAG: molybdopterin molybdotransferase MoeA, partial [Anaeromyxobacteraceae bacterium]|nr:molybdopterin molybdotransferase MoeA [Anaeromyxobacteraceae bacterium]
MLTPAEALARILATTAEVGLTARERLPLEAAAGRVLAEDLRAPRALPPFAASTMDGYALRAAEAPRAGTRLRVAFEVAAGHPAPAPLPRGACCRIFTGAPLPRGADCVEMQEQVERRGELAILRRGAEAGRFVRPEGDDLARGDLALATGVQLDPGAIGLAASLGRQALLVRRRPRVVILPTGDEVVPLGTRPGPGQIVESNAHALAAAVAAAGGEARRLPIAGDDRRALRVALRQAAGADVLVTTGGVSVGDRDLVREALEAAGARLDFWRVAMRPGKPLAFGRMGQTLVFGLPGNPASALTTFELFGRPALRALTGLSGSGRVVVRARLAAPQEKPVELTVYLRARVIRHADGLFLHPLRTQASGNLTSTAGVGA